MKYSLLIASIVFNFAGSVMAKEAPTPAKSTLASDILLGGEGSTQVFNRNGFLQPLGNLPTHQKIDYAVGFGLFRKLWVSSPSTTAASDGLGPLYNARSCLACHIRGGRASAPSEENTSSLLLRLSIPQQVSEPVYGKQLQSKAVRGLEAEGQIQLRYQTQTVALKNGEIVQLRKPTYTVTNLAYGMLHEQVMISPRLAPPVIGLGLLAAISDRDLLKNADPDDNNKDGISGRANRVWNLQTQKLAIGRFGYKAGTATLDEQNQSAFNTDIGISTPLGKQPWGDCSPQQSKCLNAPHGNDVQFQSLEAPQKVTDAVLFYIENVAVPQRRQDKRGDVLAGQQVFRQLKCSSCHTPSFTTQKIAGKPALSAQTIRPYSDLLLHDMGDGLADHRPEAAANGREWRTSPLWGIGLTKRINPKAGYLHDGRARTLTEAILWHGGEAAVARNQFIELGNAQREQLLTFLDAL